MWSVVMRMQTFCILPLEIGSNLRWRLKLNILSLLVVLALLVQAQWRCIGVDTIQDSEAPHENKEVMFYGDQ